MKALSLFLAILIIFTFSACSMLGGGKASDGGKPAQSSAVSSEKESEESQDSEDVEEPGTSAGDSSVASGERAFSVTPPEGWDVVKDEQYMMMYTKQGASCIAAHDYTAGSKSDEEYVAYAQEQFKEFFDNVQVTGPEKVTINGISATKLELSYEMAGIEMKQQTYYIFKDGQTFTLTVGAFGGDAMPGLLHFDELQPEFDEFINSFEIL